MKRALNFFEVDLSEPSETIECINLLKAMELEEDIEEEKEEEMLDSSMEVNLEDDEMLNLPKEWIYDL